MDAIVINNLSKVYKGLGHHKSLDRLSLTIAENEVFGFLGRNGAGKTTTIEMLCSLLKPTRARPSVLARHPHPPRPATHRLSAGAALFLRISQPQRDHRLWQAQGLTRAGRDHQWDKLSELLEYRENADQRIKGFSKGMRQRIGFAVALMAIRPLLILDEPMSGLDPIGRRMIREMILRLRDEKKTLFFSSHVLGDVEQIC